MTWSLTPTFFEETDLVRCTPVVPVNVSFETAKIGARMLRQSKDEHTGDDPSSARSRSMVSGWKYTM